MCKPCSCGDCMCVCRIMELTTQRWPEVDANCMKRECPSDLNGPPSWLPKDANCCNPVVENLCVIVMSLQTALKTRSSLWALRHQKHSCLYTYVSLTAHKQRMWLDTSDDAALCDNNSRRLTIDGYITVRGYVDVQFCSFYQLTQDSPTSVLAVACVCSWHDNKHEANNICNLHH